MSMDRAPRVLVVEDNEVNRKVAVTMFHKLGCQTDVSVDGKQALEALQTNDYDLIFMDCQMPEMDGYQATAEIRALEGHKRLTPIIAMTAHALEGSRERCLASGMDDYLSKPLRLEEVEQALKHWHNESRLRSGQQPMSESASQQPFDTSIDAEVFGEMQELMGSSMQELIELFIRDGDQQLADLRDEVARGDWAALAKTAHKLKSISFNVGAVKLANLCGDLEAAAMAGTVDTISAQGAEITALYDATKQALRTRA